MTRSTTSDLDHLAGGEHIQRDAFLSLLSDPARRQELAKLAQVQAMFEPDLEAQLANLPPSDITFDEFVAFLNHKLKDDRRRGTVEAYLREHLPERLEGRPGSEIDRDTEVVSEVDVPTEIIEKADPERDA